MGFVGDNDLYLDLLKICYMENSFRREDWKGKGVARRLGNKEEN